MIISDRFRFVFVHIPKCGGTSVRKALARFDERDHVYFSRGRNPHDQLGFLDYHHIPLTVLREHFTEDFECVRNYASFALARDPFARFSSSLSERIIWRGRDPQKLTSREIAREVDEVIEYLSDSALKMPVIEPDFIHFARQIDYVDCDGERFIDYIYPVARLPYILRHIGELTHATVECPERENERLSYNNKALQYADTLTKRIIMATVPRRMWKPVFRTFKKYFLTLGILDKWRHRHASVFKSDKVSRFVAEFYADDVRLYEQARVWANYPDSFG